MNKFIKFAFLLTGFLILKFFLFDSSEDIEKTEIENMTPEIIQPAKQEAESSHQEISPVKNRLSDKSIKVEEKKSEDTSSDEELPELNDEKFLKLVKDKKHEEIADYIREKSDENINFTGQITKEDYQDKLAVMDKYIKHYPQILENEVDLTLGYYFLNISVGNEEKTNEVAELIKKHHSKKEEVKSMCLDFYKAISKEEPNFELISKIVSSCARNKEKRTVIGDYIHFLKRKNEDVMAQEEALKFKELYPEIPNYADY